MTRQNVYVPDKLATIIATSAQKEARSNEATVTLQQQQSTMTHATISSREKSRDD